MVTRAGRWGGSRFPDEFDRRLVRLQGTLIGTPVAGTHLYSVQTENGQPLTVRFAPGSRGFVAPPETGRRLAHRRRGLPVHKDLTLECKVLPAPGV